MDMNINILNYALRRYETSCVARCFYETFATKKEKNDNAVLIQFLKDNKKNLKYKITQWLFMSTDRKIYSSFFISHMYNNTHGRRDCGKHFFNQNLGFITFLRLTIVFFGFVYMRKSRVMKKIFREFTSDTEYNAMKMLLTHYSR